MRDISKKLTVVNTDIKDKSADESKSTPKAGGNVVVQGANGNWLAKDVWDSVFELIQSEGGETYLHGKLPVVLQYGLTTYSVLDAAKILPIAKGLPFDGITIKYNDETEQIEVIGGTGGGAEDSIHWDKIEGKPDFTDYAKKDDLDGFVKTDGSTVITGLQKFTKGLQGGTGWKISHFYNGNTYFAFNSSLTWLIAQYGTEKMEIGNSSAPLTVYKNGNAEIFGDGIVNGNLLVKGGLTFYSTNGAATSFLIDVTSADKITSTSTTQVYTANSIRLLKNEVMTAKAKAESCESSLKSIKSAITNALNGVSSSSSASKIGQALEELCDILSEL